MEQWSIKEGNYNSIPIDNIITSTIPVYRLAVFAFIKSNNFCHNKLLLIFEIWFHRSTTEVFRAQLWVMTLRASISGRYMYIGI